SVQPLPPSIHLLSLHDALPISPTPDVHTPGAHHERDAQSREGHRTLMITLLSTSDTDLLSARASGADFRLGNPRFLDADALRGLVEGSDAVVYRQLGSRHAIADHLDVITASGVPLVVVSGEQAPDADLMSASTVPAGVARQTHDYLAFGGPGNLGQLWAFLADTL